MHASTRRRKRFTTFIVLWLAGALSAGCASTIATCNLRKAQGLFNDASAQIIHADPTAAPPPAALDQYREAVSIVDQKVLPNVSRDDLKVNALAILAFSEWRLGNCEQAVNRAEEGINLHQQARLTTNKRDYGMLLIADGLCMHSKAYQAFKDKGSALLTVDEAKQITASMDASLAVIDRVNQELAPDDDIVIWANEQQLQIMKNAIDVWGRVANADDRRQPICAWSTRADAFVASRFPAQFPRKPEVLQLQHTIDRARARFEPC